MRRSVIAGLLTLTVASCQAPPSPTAERADRLPQFVLFFHDGGVALTADARQIVARIATAADRLHPAQIDIVGEAGGPERDKLANERAAAVASALTRDGVDPNIIARAGEVAPKAALAVAAHKVTVRFRPAAG